MRIGIALIEDYAFSRAPVTLGIAGLAAAARRLEELGFDAILASETAGHDPFLPLVVAAEHTRSATLFTGVAVAFARAPMAVAQMAWDLQRFSAGRFVLGLGTQVKGHNERRYGVPWTAPPVPRLREYVHCLRAIFATFQQPTRPTRFEGAHYRYTLAPPVFTARPIEHPHVPIHLAALGPAMSRLAGEVADGVFAHPVCTARYLREVLLPAVAEGARRAGRSPGDVEIVGAPIVVAAADEEELREEKQLLKRRVAFYASTRTYHPVFAVHGWDALGARLHALSLESRWDEMVALIPDEMAEEFGTVARVEEVGAILAERWGDLLGTLYLPTDYPLRTPAEERLARAMLERARRQSPCLP